MSRRTFWNHESAMLNVLRERRGAPHNHASIGPIKEREWLSRKRHKRRHRCLVLSQIQHLAWPPRIRLRCSVSDQNGFIKEAMMRKVKLAAALLTSPAWGVAGKVTQCLRGHSSLTCCVLLFQASVALAQPVIPNIGDPTTVAVAEQKEVGGSARPQSEVSPSDRPDESQLHIAASLAKAGDFQSAESRIRTYLGHAREFSGGALSSRISLI